MSVKYTEEGVAISGEGLDHLRSTYAGSNAEPADATSSKAPAADLPMLTREQAAVIGAFTGITCSPFSCIHEYAERVLGRSIWTHEFASERLMEELKEAARADFMKLVYKPQDEG